MQVNVLDQYYVTTTLTIYRFKYMYDLFCLRTEDYFESFDNEYFLLMEAGSHMFLGYIMKSRWKHGRKWWMLFMPKVPSFSANCGMSAVHLIKVPIYLEIQFSLISNDASFITYFGFKIHCFLPEDKIIDVIIISRLVITLLLLKPSADHFSWCL